MESIRTSLNGLCKGIFIQTLTHIKDNPDKLTDTNIKIFLLYLGTYTKLPLDYEDDEFFEIYEAMMLVREKYNSVFENNLEFNNYLADLDDEYVRRTENFLINFLRLRLSKINS